MQRRPTASMLVNWRFFKSIVGHLVRACVLLAQVSFQRPVKQRGRRPVGMRQWAFRKWHTYDGRDLSHRKSNDAHLQQPDADAGSPFPANTCRHQQGGQVALQ
ncbi:hypothetical protein BKA80DRAFT_268758, partial [Phyllosticta citrichinensis]